MRFSNDTPIWTALSLALAVSSAQAIPPVWPTGFTTEDAGELYYCEWDQSGSTDYVREVYSVWNVNNEHFQYDYVHGVTGDYLQIWDNWDTPVPTERWYFNGVLYDEILNPDHPAAFDAREDCGLSTGINSASGFQWEYWAQCDQYLELPDSSFPGYELKYLFRATPDILAYYSGTPFQYQPMFFNSVPPLPWETIQGTPLDQFGSAYVVVQEGESKRITPSAPLNWFKFYVDVQEVFWPMQIVIGPSLNLVGPDNMSIPTGYGIDPDVRQQILNATAGSDGLWTGIAYDPQREGDFIYVLFQAGSLPGISTALETGIQWHQDATLTAYWYKPSRPAGSQIYKIEGIKRLSMYAPPVEGNDTEAIRGDPTPDLGGRVFMGDAPGHRLDDANSYPVGTIVLPQYVFHTWLTWGGGIATYHEFCLRMAAVVVDASNGGFPTVHEWRAVEINSIPFIGEAPSPLTLEEVESILSKYVP